MRAPSAVWIGAIVLLLAGPFFIWLGYRMFGEQNFGPNLQAEAVGLSLSTGLALLILMIGFEIERRSREGALNAARFLFLREKAEKYKEAYIRYIDTFRLGGRTALKLSGASWQSFDKKHWPDIKDVKNLKITIHNRRLSRTYNARSVSASINDLWSSLQDVVNSSATSIYEGHEHLAKNALFTALFTLGTLRQSVIPFLQGHAPASQISLIRFRKGVKDTATVCGTVLEDLCKFSRIVKLC